MMQGLLMRDRNDQNKETENQALSVDLPGNRGIQRSTSLTNCKSAKNRQKIEENEALLGVRSLPMRD